jgi:hypothetical protein
MKPSLIPVERVEAFGGMVHGSGFTVRGWTAKRPRYEIGVKFGEEVQEPKYRRQGETRGDKGRQD